MRSLHSGDRGARHEVIQSVWTKKILTPIEHSVFNIFLYYRRGFAEGSAFIKANYLKEILH
jgi:hypothetical protein